MIIIDVHVAICANYFTSYFPFSLALQVFANNEKKMYLKVIEESTSITVTLTFYLLKLILYLNLVEMLYRKKK